MSAPEDLRTTSEDSTDSFAAAPAADVCAIEPRAVLARVDDLLHPHGKHCNTLGDASYSDNISFGLLGSLWNAVSLIYDRTRQSRPSISDTFAQEAFDCLKKQLNVTKNIAFAVAVYNTHGVAATLKSQNLAVVNAFGTGGNAVMSIVKQELGMVKLKEAAKLQGVKFGRKHKSVGLVSGIFLFDNPLWHLIHRLCVYLAPGSNKDWAYGRKLFELMHAHTLVKPLEKHIFEWLASVHGSSNCLFWVRAPRAHAARCARCPPHTPARALVLISPLLAAACLAPPPRSAMLSPSFSGMIASSRSWTTSVRRRWPSAATWMA